MKILVLGASASGKTPMARRLSAELGLAHVPASAWVRARFPASPSAAALSPEERQDFIERITRFSIAELSRNPWICLEHLDAHHELGRCVIEGVRNPFDFVHLYDPRTDIVVWLEHAGTVLRRTAFESGLDVIAEYLAWLDRTGIAGGGRRLRYRFGHFRRTDVGARPGDTLEDAIEAAVSELAPLTQSREVTPSGAPARVHAAIPPLRAHVRAEYLYGMDPGRVGQYVPCTATVVSSYPGDAPTFQILMPDGAVFSYVPPSALVDPGRLGPPELDLEDLVYFNCPDEEIVVHRHAALEGPVLAYFKRKDLWLEGTYLFSVEWWTGNQLCHAIDLANGQLAMLPHHKLKFGAGHGPGFEPYKKMRKIWRVSGGE